MRKILVFILGILFGTSSILAQAPKKLSSSEIHQSIQKLNFLGTALYIAAHPDDENTRLISYLSNHANARTAYLALTRGDGGQNLIGPELRELLGVLRTQELLGARRIDGGEQYFTRANDFGFSKHPDETLKIWNKEEVLGDVVWTIRNLKPDVIINRFDHRTPGSTHGHHTSSAMLSVEAFDLANDASAYPEQLKSTSVWQPKRAFFNTSWWFYGSQENFEKADKSNMVSMDVGVYYPSKGLSNNEIASLASSNHLCQGFGRMTTRGSENEYIELIKGDMPNDPSNVFDGINTTWSRIKGGKAIGEILYDVEKHYDFVNPSKHLPQLVEAYKLIQNISDEHWKKRKTLEIKEIIQAVSGLYLEASAQASFTNPGSSVKINIEALNRSNSKITLSSVSLVPENVSISNTPLEENEKVTLELNLNVPENASYSSPYWLNEEGSLGMYAVKDKSLIGKPETPRPFNVHFVLDFNGQQITFVKPVVYRYSKPDKGELYQPFEVLPIVTTSMADDVIIFADAKSQDVSVKIKAGKNDLTGQIQLNTPNGWVVAPEKVDFAIKQKGDEQTVIFSVSPPSYETEGEINPIVTVNGKAYTKELIEIAYDHIPTQSVLSLSKAKVVRLNIQKVGENIGYIVGAGDKVPESLEQIGYKVHTIDVNSIQEGTLSKYDGIVVGIRAYNVVSELKFKQHFLLDYVKEGGNLILQYNTSGRNGLNVENLAPYPLKVSRDRVTNENSNVTILAKNHALVNFPNPITQKDFDGWVQERGLYFPNEWGEEFTSIFSMSDEGESVKEGALLVAPYGKGNYIYTGLSFFRELPAGVSGAYKIFANMLSLGKGDLDKDIEIKG
ncbi:LmbE family N-acetylglucosaminyl deacetylase/signal recognition particle subunit SEC65 [Saonia flava]|uniref:LmbE family N-acetylglucosaminyl deacetylase/signal recognition particle subunit SEC65 n=1 Tax=Saonia flava TaxID=523696 RepID=A0A846QSI1_9FLAO|nr:PIG-L family deacetylase [Saonia flava]NJB70167.1 LmbE family N-acetylglucosaminyl deacetylase/signal recognition particle subunit SEC65 [Saonia flava]